MVIKREKSLKPFEEMTIKDLRKIKEDFLKCEDILIKQAETIRLLKIKYPTKKIIDDFKDV